MDLLTNGGLYRGLGRVQVDDYVSGLVSVTDMDSKPLAGKKLGLVKQTMGDGVDVRPKCAFVPCPQIYCVRENTAQM